MQVNQHRPILWLAAALVLGQFLPVSTLAAEPPPATPAEIVAISANPPAIRLVGPGATWSILVDGQTADGRLVDLTRETTFRSLTEGILSVSPAGVVQGRADGEGTVELGTHGRTLTIAVTVTGSTLPKTFNFENDVVPLLSRFGCNSSGCHGKAEGQNGFKLSVFGFDPPADYDALTKEGRGRRVFPVAPEWSLLLRKAAGGLPHGGGVRIPPESREYALLRAWIAAGTPAGAAADPKVVSIELTPRERLMHMGAAQQLRVVARYSDGREEDVTPLARFQSNQDAVAAVDPAGLVAAGEVPGQAAVMASYMSAVDVFRVVVPQPAASEPFPAVADQSFVDPLVWDQLRKLNIHPSELADDAEFLRRTYLDVIGTLPTAAEARAFLADTRPDRRAYLLDELVERPEFNSFWALFWADVLRVDREVLGHKGAHRYFQWIHDSLAAHKPLDQFVRDVLTAEGPLVDVPQANFYQAVTDPGQMASTVSQVFLGVRIACAQCHHHPYDQWSQTDYYGMQAFFTQVGRKSSALGPMLVSTGNPETRHPRTGELVLAHALLTTAPEKLPDGDRRRLLADWLTAPENPWFARNIANRVWAHFLGRGLVEPVDDVRATNPPTNPPLLDGLARHVVETRYDLRALIKAICGSRVYQLSSRPNPTNQRDEQNYSRALFKRLRAEVLLDAVCQTTGVEEKFAGVPSGSRAVDLWDSQVPHYFLKLFGRPIRHTSCECERSSEASVAQVLNLMNSPAIQDKLSHEGGTVARLVRQLPSNDSASNESLADELYLTYFNRFPSPQELQTAVDYLAAAGPSERDRRRAAEDLAWSMLNSLEFIFNH